MSERINSRGDYDNKVENTQSSVDATLGMLQEDIDLANLNIAEYIKRDGAKGGEEYLSSIITYLNENWKYANHSFLLTGHAHKTKIVAKTKPDTGLELSMNLERDEVHFAATSAGFSAINVPNEQGNMDVKVALAFYGSRQTINTTAGLIEVVPRLYAEPREVALTYIRPVNAEVVSASIDECVETIDELSKSFIEQTSDDNSEFYGMSLEEQQAFFKSYIDGIDATLPDPQARDFLSMQDAVSPLFYIVGSDDEDKVALFSIESGADDKPTARINGAVIGFCVPDEIVNQGRTRYTSRSELMAASSGLCAIVKPFPGSNLYLPEDMQSSDMIVPISDLSDVDYSLI